MALTGKQAIFVEKYLTCFNATQSAIQAGYSPKTAYSIGAENLKKPEIAEIISQRLSETAMTADEVLMRLADHARGSMDDFLDITPSGPAFNFQVAADKKKLGLIRKLKTKTRCYVIKDDDAPVTETDVEFELYDAQAALALIGKHHKLFVDRTEVTGKDGQPLKADLNHAIDGDTAQSIFDVLASVGVLPSPAGDAAADEIHHPQT